MNELVTEKLSNGNKITYQIVNGTAYNAKTNERVVDCLESVRSSGARIRIFLGDTETGEDWMEEFETIGTVGRSTGSIKIPLLIQKATSMGGGALLDDSIVRIMKRGYDGKYKDVYRHPAYHQAEMKIIEINVEDLHYGVWMSNYPDLDYSAGFKTKEQAERWIKFMKGESARK